MPALAFAVATVIAVGVVTAEVPIGLMVFQARVVLQLLCPAAIVQLVAVSVPDGPGGVANVAFEEYPVPIVLVTYPL